MDSLPSCALSCLISALNNSTCSLTDFACICADAQLNAQLTPCMLVSCTVRESLTAQNYSYSTCQYPASENTVTFPIVNIVGIIVAIVSVILRGTYRILAGQLGLDDYTICAALLVAAAICGVGFPLKDHGLGKNIWTVPFSDISETLKLFFIEEVLYTICTALIKLSMLFLYLRLFPNALLRKAVFVSLAITSLWAIGSFLAQVLSCKPISYYWNQWDGEHEGRCTSHNALLLAHSIINIFLDILVIALPMPVLVKLQMSIEKRVGMCLMFAVGLVVTIISILRLVETVGFNDTTNPTKDFVPVGVWSLLEIDVGIMCSCMPGIRALTKRLYSTLFKNGSQPSSGYRYGSRQSKPGSGGSGSGSAHRVQSPFKSGSSNSNAGGGGQFIRLEEVDSRETDTTNHLWPLREFPAVTVPPKDSVRVIKADVQTQGHPWRKQREYSDDSKPSPLLPPTRYEDPRAHYCLFSKKAAIARASKGSSHFTWFRDGDST
ncbi:CFEM domain-containing protein [Aspergillus foveolatus]|uniref:CFEM domain-containing protein n=1 Tax=Aspergillus foveolatus TaxID=210207 RepID=UPI003CCD101C